jgi:hypothetical protein
MKNHLFSLAILPIVVFPLSTYSQGALNVNAAISDVQAGSLWDYTVTLNNAPGSSSVETFWFDWTPGNFYLSVNPTTVTPPSGWTIATQSGSIEFNTSTAPLTAGSSLNFAFASTEAPAQVFADSSKPADSSAVYTGPAAFSGSQELFNVTPSAVPEPSSIMLILTGLMGTGFISRASKLASKGFQSRQD